MEQRLLPPKGGMSTLPALREIKAVVDWFEGKEILALDFRFACDAGDTALFRKDINGNPLSWKRFRLSTLAPWVIKVMRLLVILCLAKRNFFAKNAPATRRGRANQRITKETLISLKFFESTKFDVNNYRTVDVRVLKGDFCEENAVDALADDKGACSIRVKPPTLFIWFNPSSEEIARWEPELSAKRARGLLNYVVVSDWREIGALVLCSAAPCLPAVISSRSPAEQREIRELLDSIYPAGGKGQVQEVLRDLYRTLSWPSRD